VIRLPGARARPGSAPHDAHGACRPVFATQVQSCRREDERPGTSREIHLRAVPLCHAIPSSPSDNIPPVTTVRALAHRGLLAIGRRLPTAGFQHLHDALAWVELGHWLADQPGANGTPREFASKDALFAHALGFVRGSRTQYLEFGVYQGKSLRWWAEHLTDPSARFVGFDSFRRIARGLAPQYSGGRVPHRRPAAHRRSEGLVRRWMVR